jgi:hypothetical protein
MYEAAIQKSIDDQTFTTENIFTWDLFIILIVCAVLVKTRLLK